MNIENKKKIITVVDPKIKNKIFEIMYLSIPGIIFYILALRKWAS